MFFCSRVLLKEGSFKFQRPLFLEGLPSKLPRQMAAHEIRHGGTAYVWTVVRTVAAILPKQHLINVIAKRPHHIDILRRIGSINSHAILGGLHRHYVRM
jgi:hypothetical protein